MERNDTVNIKMVIPKRNHDAAFRVIDGEAVVVLPSRSEVKILSEVGSRIWELMDGKTTISQICETICMEYDVSPETALDDVLNFIKEIGDEGMLES